jgi:hypothetical protein
LSGLTSVLSDLTKKNVSWSWGPEQQKAFEAIKKQFLEDIVIEYPDFNKQFYLSSDASRTHIGAELFQVNEQGKHQTLGFASRTLNSAEQNYYTTELELLAIVFGCKKFRNYILGYATTVLTDHHALTFLNKRSSRKKTLNYRKFFTGYRANQVIFLIYIKDYYFR